jgi:hypothetical protein
MDKVKNLTKRIGPGRPGEETSREADYTPAQLPPLADVAERLEAYLYRLPKTWADYHQQRRDFTADAKPRLQRLARGNGNGASLR